MSGIKLSILAVAVQGRAWEEAAAGRDHVMFCALETLHVCQCWVWNMQHSNSKDPSSRMQSREPGTLD